MMRVPVRESPAASVAPTVLVDALPSPEKGPSGSAARGVESLRERSAWRGQFVQTAVGMLVFQGVTFLTGVVVARNLSPAEVGRFQLLNTIVVFVGFFARVGLDEGLAYLVPKHQVSTPGKVRPLITYSIGFAVLGGVVLGIPFFILAEFLEDYVFTIPGFATDLRIVLWLLPLTMLLQMGIAALRSLGRSDLRALVFYYVVGLSFFGLVVLFAWLGLTLSRTYDARLMSYALGGVLAVVLAMRVAGRKRQPLQRADLGELHAFAGIVVFVWVFQYIVEQPILDLVIVARVAEPEQVGIYAVAARVAGLGAIATVAMALVLGPALAKALSSGDKPAAQRLYATSSLWLARVGLFSGLGVLLLRSELLALFGPQYLEGADIVTVFAACYIGVSLLGVNTPLLLASKLARVELVLTGAGAAMMLVSGIVLGIHFGSRGVGIATAATILALAIARRYVCSTRLIPRLGFSRGPLVVSAGLAFAIALAIKQTTHLDRSYLGLVMLATIYGASFLGLSLATNSRTAIVSKE